MSISYEAGSFYLVFYAEADLENDSPEKGAFGCSASSPPRSW